MRRHLLPALIATRQHRWCANSFFYINWVIKEYSASKCGDIYYPRSSRHANIDGARIHFLGLTRNPWVVWYERVNPDFFHFFCISLISYNSHHNSRAQSRDRAGAEASAVARRPKEASREKTRPPPVSRGYSPWKVHFFFKLGHKSSDTDLGNTTSAPRGGEGATVG